MDNEVLAKLLAESQALYVRAAELLPAVLAGLIFLVIAILIAAPIGRFVERQTAKLSGSALLSTVVGRLCRFVFWALGLYLFLRLVGLSGFALTILSSAGVAGIIIGFAFKDIAENFIASLLLSVQKPFKLHDIIEVDGVTGVVQKVTSRATTLVDFDGDHIQIPNATVYKSRIRNITANPRGRVTFTIGIGYENSIREAQSIALTQLNEHSHVLQDPEPLVLVDHLGSSTINLKVSFWIDVNQYSPLKMKSLAIRLVLRALEDAGVSMPDDARERIFPEGLAVKTLTAAEETEAGATERQHDENSRTALDDGIDGTEDLSSEGDDIKKQAALAASPDQGENIL